MAVTLAGFRDRFPEFEHATDAYITAHLTDLDGEVAADINAAIRDSLVYYLTADRIASSPWGYRARLAQPGAETAYASQARALMFKAARRGLVIYGSGTTPLV